MSDAPWIGVWRRIGIGASHHSHLVIERDRLWTVSKTWVLLEGDPAPERTYEIHARGALYEIRIARRDGEQVGLLAREGSRLRVTLSHDDEAPLALDDVTHAECSVYEPELDETTRARLAEPIPRVPRLRRVHGKLGELTFDPNIEWWSGRLAAGELVPQAIEVSVAAPESASDETFDRAADSISRIELAAVLAKASDELLAVHNAGWRSWDDGTGETHEGPELSRVEFEARLVLRSVTVREEGDVELWFDDGELFWGHSVVVALDPDLVPVDATFEG